MKKNFKGRVYNTKKSELMREFYYEKEFEEDILTEAFLDDQHSFERQVNLYLTDETRWFVVADIEYRYRHGKGFRPDINTGYIYVFESDEDVIKFLMEFEDLGLIAWYFPDSLK